MYRRVIAVLFGILAWVPAAAFAQGAIAGQVKDSSSALLPGVTVEASSPALIEKVRATTTDGNGQYQITSLPSGTYSVRFTLPGFNSVNREGITLTSGFTANVEAELRVGAVEETVTVTGESPIVDVQNARQQTVLEGDTLRELPTGRSASQLLALVPGMTGGSGVCTGGLCGPTLNAYSAHGGNNAEGRLQVDGLSAGAAIGGAGVSGYLVDVGTSQEIAFSLSGNLGEAEVGGPVINIVPRSGGNTVSGNYFTSYTRNGLFAVNNKNHPNILVVNSLENDHDVSGALGGPVVRDYLWYYFAGRHNGRRANSPNTFRNLNEGVFAANYAPDLTKPVQATSTRQNYSLRMTWQATARNKFQFFWDEQDWCETCEGSTQNTSPEAATTASVGPNRIRQLTWTNPLNNRLLFEAGVSALDQKWGIWPSFSEPFYRNIPRVVETGAGALGGNITSGAQTVWDSDAGNYNVRAAASYITGTHNVKVGYQGSHLLDWTTMDVNNTRLHYTYTTPQGGGTPVPSSFTMYARPRTTDERTSFAALYAQDSWTMKRLTVQGAVRYDHAWSFFPEQATGPDRFIPVGYSFPKTDGVSYNDVTTRWGATLDVFGTGKTAIKFNMGKYLQPANVGGIYNATNPIRRSPDSVTRSWTDLNNNRIVDCDFTNPADHTVAGGDRCFAMGSVAQFGLDPRVTGLGFTTTHCGNADPGVPASVLAYCQPLGQNLLSGWGVREYDWQFGLGVQHELLPRISMDVTYNRRWYGNFQLTDNIALGCNLDVACIGTSTDGFRNPDYDYYTVTAPTDSRLPDGGGYVVSGLTDIKPTSAGRPTQNAVSITDLQTRYWHGVDTMFNIRAQGSLRISVGTSTGRQVTDNCAVRVDNPTITGGGGAGDRPVTDCRVSEALRTDLRGSVTYTVPKLDVLVSSVYQYRPGPSIRADYTVNCTAGACSAVTWDPNSGRTTFASGTTKTINLLPLNSQYADGNKYIDVKIAKIVRFSGLRLNVGMDIYNILNDDGVTAYNFTYNPNAATGNPWMTPTTLVTPRFARFQVQVDF